MRLRSTYRASRRNDWFNVPSKNKTPYANRRQLNKDFKRVDGSNWKQDFSVNVTPIGNEYYVRGKTYPYESSREWETKFVISRDGQWFWIDETGDESSPYPTQHAARGALRQYADSLQ